MSDLARELAEVLNRYSRENVANTPDFLLAEYMLDALAAAEKLIVARDGWYGRRPKPGGEQMIEDQPEPQLSDGPPIVDLVVQDLEERKRVGIERYGMPLRAHNGRDALVDAYQEALDLTVYLRQTLQERPTSDAVTQDTSDGYHTFRELYAHRRALTAALATTTTAWRSKSHHPLDAPIYDGFFIVGIEFPTVGAITYHYELEHWDDFRQIPALEHAPKWDGATPDDTVTRLLEWARA